MIEVPTKARVGVGHGNDRIEAVRRAFEAIGGIRRWVHEGSRVLIKPNMMTALGTPTVTHIDLIKGLYLLCKEAGASEVWVGENAVCGMPTRRHFEFAGFHNALEAIGCKVRYFEDEPWVYVERERNYCLKDVHLPQALVEADVIIDAPVAKTHEATTTTLGLKNFHGILADEDKARHHRGRPESGSSLMEKFVDIFAFVKDLGKPVLCACDMFDAMEGQGPAFGDIVRMGLVVASDDVVACDAVVEALMGFPNLYGLLTSAAHRRGVGIGDMHYIEVLGEPVEKHRREFKPAEWRPLELEGEGIRVLAGDFCHGGCQMLLRYIIDTSRISFHKDKREFGDIYILCGLNPPPPPSDALVVVYGDCAIYSTWHYSYRQRPKKIGPWWKPRVAFVDVPG
ncbi:MAG TPA: DUF362 domain-containing protein, partial [Proteobacteria bacterium]|nr:DUF362 domain-containing protein [Pseudomonadota bacterium]